MISTMLELDRGHFLSIDFPKMDFKLQSNLQFKWIGIRLVSVRKGEHGSIRLNFFILTRFLADWEDLVRVDY